MIPNQNIPIKFGQGIDTKSDPKTVVPGKLLQLRDMIQVSANQWRKRNGYNPISTAILGGGNLVSPKMIKSFENELICADSGLLYSYSPTQSAWVPKGNYQPVAVSKNVVSRASGTLHLGAVSAVLGNIALFAWNSTTSNSSNTPTAAVIDLASGVQLVSEFKLTSTIAGRSSVGIQCVVLGSTSIAVFYHNSAGHIAFRILSLSVGSASIGSETVLVADGGFDLFEICNTPAGAAIVYLIGIQVGTVSINVSTLNSSGAILNTTSIADPLTLGCFSINSEPGTHNIWVYWTNTANTTVNFTMRYAVYTSTLAAVLAPTDIFTGVQSPLSVTAVSTSSGVQSSFVCSIGSNGFGYADNYSTFITKAVVNSSGAVTVSFFSSNLFLQSSCFSVNGKSYFICSNYSTIQPTLFAVSTSDNSVLAKMFVGTAADYRNGSYVNNIVPGIGNAPKNLVSPYLLGGSKVLFACSEAFEANPLSAARNPILGASYGIIDFANQELFNSVSANGNLILNGGFVSAYDGEQVSELNFHLFPEILAITPNASGGSMADGTYLYKAVFQYTDAAGNLHQSAPSVGTLVNISGGGGFGSVSIYIKSLPITAKNVEIHVFRTVANGSSASMHETNSTVFPALNQPTATYVAFIDKNSDNSILSNAAIYTQGGVIENTAPPPAMVFLLRNNRLWLIDSENKNTVWYTKTFQVGAGINFSDLLTTQVDATGGDCIALASMDDKLVVFEENQPLIIQGDGAGDTGQGSTLSNPLPIPADTGCINSKGVITFPGGVIAKTKKGIYLLDRALNYKYFGSEVEAFNSQDVTAVTMLKDKNQIVFLTDTLFGLTLVYDYVFGQWSTFTNTRGYSADVWNGAYVYARTDGTIYQEAPGYYLDDGVPFYVQIKTSWLSFAGIQGFQRVRDFLMLGNYANGATPSHGVKVSAAYDFVDSFSTPILIYFGPASTSGVFQYEESLPRQKCTSISLLIQEQLSGDPLEFISFTDMSFMAGIKRGLNKLPSSRRVG